VKIKNVTLSFSMRVPDTGDDLYDVLQAICVVRDDLQRREAHEVLRDHRPGSIQDSGVLCEVESMVCQSLDWVISADPPLGPFEVRPRKEEPEEPGPPSSRTVTRR
jgi:hypothetical protein